MILKIKFLYVQKKKKFSCTSEIFFSELNQKFDFQILLFTFFRTFQQIFEPPISTF